MGAGDLRALAGDLDRLVQGARPLPLAREHVMVEREAAYDVLDRTRSALPSALKAARWYREKRREAGDPPLRDPAVDIDILHQIDAVDDLIHTSKAVPLTDKVRMHRDTLAGAVDPLRASLIALAQELADFEDIYPNAF